MLELPVLENTLNKFIVYVFQGGILEVLWLSFKGFSCLFIACFADFLNVILFYTSRVFGYTILP